MTIFAWVLAAYLASMLVIALAETDWTTDELIALATWPISIPLGAVWRRIHNARRTCPVCKHRFGRRDFMLAHRDSAHEEQS